MRLKVLAAALLICCFAIVNVNVLAAPPDGVYLYEHTNYEGKCIRLTSNVSSLLDYDFNDKISSIRIVGDYYVTVYQHTKFEGWSKDYYNDTRYVGDSANDQISSIIIRRKPSHGQRPEPGPVQHPRYRPEPPRRSEPSRRPEPEHRFEPGRQPIHRPGPAPGVYLYEHANYGGKWVKLDSNVSKLKNYNFNDKTSSLKIIGRYKVTVYEHVNYKGWAYTYYNDIPNLGRINNQISSIIIRPF
jgi:hypothetical protein